MNLCSTHKTKYIMNKEYLSAPLPFVGQKRMFARKFKEVLKEFPDDAIYIDLFGGSGLLSHIKKKKSQVQSLYIMTTIIIGVD